MINEKNLESPKLQAAPTTIFTFIGDGDAELCGPDGCVIPTGHAAFTGDVAPVESGQKHAE